VKLLLPSNKALRAHIASNFTRLVGQLESQFANLVQAKLTTPTNAVVELVSEIVFEDSSLDPSSLSKVREVFLYPNQVR
jgi:hypothetical protein